MILEIHIRYYWQVILYFNNNVLYKATLYLKHLLFILLQIMNISLLS